MNLASQRKRCAGQLSNDPPSTFHPFQWQVCNSPIINHIRGRSHQTVLLSYYFIAVIDGIITDYQKLLNSILDTFTYTNHHAASKWIHVTIKHYDPVVIQNRTISRGPSIMYCQLPQRQSNRVLTYSMASIFNELNKADIRQSNPLNGNCYTPDILYSWIRPRSSQCGHFSCERCTMRITRNSCFIHMDG